MIKHLLLFVSIAISSASYSQTDTTSHSVVFGGLVKGFWKVWKNADGSYSEWFQYNDRGRGDSVRSVYRIDDQGFPLSSNSTGDFVGIPEYTKLGGEG